MSEDTCLCVMDRGGASLPLSPWACVERSSFGCLFTWVALSSAFPLLRPDGAGRLQERPIRRVDRLWTGNCQRDIHLGRTQGSLPGRTTLGAVAHLLLQAQLLADRCADVQRIDIAPNLGFAPGNRTKVLVLADLSPYLSP
jgi:hypothetical protein